MQDKKVLALIILTIFAIISLIYGIRASAKRRPSSSALPSAETVSLLPAKGSSGVERRAKRTKFTSWKRSPFVHATTASPELVLSGIIWHKDKPKAMIGDAILMKGDRIAGNTVVDIKPDRVILNDGIKDFEIKIEK